MVTTTPVARKRCPLCLAILEISHVDQGQIVKHAFDGHTPEACAASTEQRIKVLEQIHIQDARQLEIHTDALNDLGSLLGPAVTIVNAGRRWLALRVQRAADLARLRGAFGTIDRANHHPLWQAEEEVAGAITDAIDAVEKRLRS